MKINQLEIKDTENQTQLILDITKLEANTSNEEIVLLMDEVTNKIKEYCLKKKPTKEQKKSCGCS